MRAEILVPPPPHISEENKEHQATFQIDGLYPGYGVTLGTVLRRVLLSSLPGAAITRAKIEGVEHEFSTIPGVREDVITLLLRLKQVRFRVTSSSDDPQIVRVRVKGEREVHARDLQTPTGIEVVNPDLLVATLTKKSAALDMTLFVQRGVGYVPREKHNPDKMEVGAIALDAIFTPVRKVTMDVEDMRVGTETNYNRLRMMIETDGSIAPQEAWQQAIAILQQQFAALQGKETEESLARSRELFSHPFTFTPKERETAPALSAEEYLKMRISEMGLNSRTVHVLESAGIKTVSGLVRKSGEDLRSLDGIGDKALQEIRRLLGTMGLSLKVD